MHNESPEGRVNVIDGGLRFPYGSDREDEVLRVTGIEHEMEFEPGTARFRSGRVELTLRDGSVKRYTVRPILPCFLGEGGYADPERWHGSYRGKLVVEGHSLDLTDAKPCSTDSATRATTSRSGAATTERWATASTSTSSARRNA